VSEVSDIDSRGFGRFFLPGPTEVRPEILEAQVRPMFGHRGQDMKDLMRELQVGLKDLFRTERPVLVSTSSATGLMEAAVRNGVPRKMLALVNGAFSERFAKIGTACGREVDLFEVPWGGGHEPEEVERRLAEGDYDAVTVVHSETSTGVLQPLEELARVVAAHEDVLLLVDSVTGVGGAPVHTDAWALDFVLTGSQKALALPPGLALGVASPALLERAESITDRGVYFDLVSFHTNAEKEQTPNTPALSLLHALDAQLGRIAVEGVEARWQRHRDMAERCWSWVEETSEEVTGLSVLPSRQFRSPTVTCIRLPEGLMGPDVVAGMSDRGYVIGSGYGKLKPTTIRIGHMGDHTMGELNELLGVLGGVLKNLAAPAGTSASAGSAGS
jgi:predicted phosphoserine aminotransferase